MKSKPGQDATVAGYAEDAGKAALILVNKWDVGEHSPDDAKKFGKYVQDNMDI